MNKRVRDEIEDDDDDEPGKSDEDETMDLVIKHTCRSSKIYIYHLNSCSGK